MLKLLEKLQKGEIGNLTDPELAYLTPHLSYFLEDENRRAVADQILAHIKKSTQEEISDHLTALDNPKHLKPVAGLISKAVAEKDYKFALSIVAGNNFELIQRADEANDLDTLNILLDAIAAGAKDQNFKNLIKDDDYYLFAKACQAGNSNFVERCLSLIKPLILAHMLTSKWCPTGWAAKNGHSHIIDRLFAAAASQDQAPLAKRMLEEHQYLAFKVAYRTKQEAAVIAFTKIALDQEKPDLFFKIYDEARDGDERTAGIISTTHAEAILEILNGKLEKKNGRSFIKKVFEHQWNTHLDNLLSKLEAPEKIQKLLTLAESVGNDAVNSLLENTVFFKKIPEGQRFRVMQQIALFMKARGDNELAQEFLDRHLSIYLATKKLEKVEDHKPVLDTYFQFHGAETEDQKRDLVGKLLIKAGKFSPFNGEKNSILINIDQLAPHYGSTKLIETLATQEDQDFLRCVFSVKNDVTEQIASAAHRLCGAEFIYDFWTANNYAAVGYAALTHFIPDPKKDLIPFLAHYRPEDSDPEKAVRDDINSFIAHDGFEKIIHNACIGQIKPFEALLPIAKDIQETSQRKRLVANLKTTMINACIIDGIHGEWEPFEDLGLEIFEVYRGILDLVEHWQDKKVITALLDDKSPEFILTFNIYPEGHAIERDKIHQKLLEIIKSFDDLQLKRRLLTFENTDCDSFLQAALWNTGNEEGPLAVLEAAQEVIADRSDSIGTLENRKFITQLLKHGHDPLACAVGLGMQQVVDGMLTLALEAGNNKLATELLSESDFIAFASAVGQAKSELMDNLVQWADRLGGKEFIYEMLSAQGKYAGKIFSENITASNLHKLFDLAEKYGGIELVRDIITCEERAYNSEWGFSNLYNSHPNKFESVSQNEDVYTVLRNVIASLKDPALLSAFTAKYPRTLKQRQAIPSASTRSRVSSAHSLEETFVKVASTDKNVAQKPTEVVVSIGEFNLQEIMNLVDKPDVLRSLVQSNNYAAMRQAISDLPPANFRSLIKTIQKSCGNEFIAKMVSHKNYALIKHTYKQSRFDILDVLLKTTRQANMLEDVFRHDDYKLLRDAIKNERTAELITLISVLPETCHQEAVNILPAEWQAMIGLPKHEIWQEKGAGDQRWVAITGQHAPHPDLVNQSSYQFRAELYQQILPLLELAAQIANEDFNANLSAYRLACVFSNMNEIDRYLSVVAKSGAGTSSIYNTIKQATDFALPANGRWNVSAWKNFMLKYGDQGLEFIEKAPDIEAYIQKSDASFPKSPRELKDYIIFVTYDRATESLDFARLAIQHGLSVNTFNRGLDVLKAAKTKDYLPDADIDGADLGYPDYYMEKLRPDDPTGLMLGNITDCCQHLDRMDAGGMCAVHGMQSEYGGFYVWKQKTSGAITTKDAIVAQSWAWVSKHGQLVLDSYEYDSKKHDDEKMEAMGQAFFEQFAYQTIGNHNYPEKLAENTLSQRKLTIEGVRLGCPVLRDGQPYHKFDLEIVGSTRVISEMIDVCNYTDARYQYVLKPLEHFAPKNNLLPVMADTSEIEEKAKLYIQSAMTRLQNQYGIEIRAGIELECYAVDESGQPNQKIIDPEIVEKKLAQLDLAKNFEEENTTDYAGQYEAKTGLGDPLTIAQKATEVRAYLQAHAQEFGAHEFSFKPLPFADQEASSAHISISLWSAGKPLFVNDNGEDSALMKQVAKSSIDVQKSAVLLYAQTDEAYSRFHHTEWSPHVIGVATVGYQGTSLRFANQDNYCRKAEEFDPAAVRIENRLASADANLYLAMAPTIAAVELALQKRMRVLNSEDNYVLDTNKYDFIASSVGTLIVDKKDVDNFSSYDLPKNRSVAFHAFQQAAESSALSLILGQDLCEAILDQQQGKVKLNSLPAKEINAPSLQAS